MRKHVILVAVMALVCPLAIGANWKAVTSTDLAVVHVDTTSISKSAIGRKAWLWFEYAAPRKFPGSFPEKYYRSVVELDHYDCVNRTSAAAQQLSYSGENKTGEVVDSRTIRNVKETLDDVVPESIGETLLNFVCTFPLSK